MKTPTTSTILNLADKMKTPRLPTEHAGKRKICSLSSPRKLSMLFLILIAAAFYTASSASSVTHLPASLLLPSQTTAKQNNKIELSNIGHEHMRSLSSIGFLPTLVPQAPPDESIATYAVVAGACTDTPKAVFVLGEGICAKVSNAPLRTPALRRFNWADTKGSVRQSEDVIADPDTNLFTIPASNTSIIDGETIDNRGTWTVSSNSTGDNTTRAIAYFNVSDPDNVAADLSVYDFSTDSDPITSGASTGFFLWLSNTGPDTAQNVHVTQATPPNMSFVSATQNSGPTFTCTNSSGVTDCTISALARGDTATITINYSVNSGAPNGVISSTADISSDTNDPRPSNNSASAQVEIREAGAPAATCALGCPSDITVSANATQGTQSGAFVTFPGGNVEVSGDCGTIDTNPASGSFFPVGTTAVAVTSSTGGGSCSFTVTVIDTAAPTITCQADQTAQATGSQTEVAVSVNQPTATGTGVSVSGSRNDNRDVTDPYPVGTTTITWTAKDSDERTASCVQRIIVTSADAPTIMCPTDKTFNSSAGCETTLTAEQIGAATATGSNVVVTSERGDHLPLTDPFPTGETIITWVATDDAGRVVSCTQRITITNTGAGDTTPPTLTIPPDLNVTTATCSALLDDELGVATADDNCSNSVAITRTGVPTFACPTPSEPGRQCESFVFPVGTTNVTYTATDAAGNSTALVQHVTVHENTSPTITAPNDVLNLNTGPGATACNTFVGDATLGSAMANDNCPGVTVARSGVPAGNLFPVGETTITYTATDASGNTAMDTQKVTVLDNTPPTISSVPAASSTDAGSCTATIPNVVAGTVASDNCGIFSVTQNPAAGTAVGLGTHTITVTVTDIHGNSSQATTSFTVNALQFIGSVWLGLKNSDDVGTKFDLLAEVFKNGSLVGSGQINNLPGGSSGFNNAILRTVNVALSSTGFCAGNTLAVRLSVRVAASSGHVSGTARLWYNDAAANSRLTTTVNGVPNVYYLRKISNALVLDNSTGTTKFTVDVLVNRNQGGNPFKPFGTWSKTF